ncbi:MAG: urea ABC transporter ATP-binding subunit UrtE [Gammaproteobacteria bacterium]|nr:urea ABC transporter ATP-binding subunit UrtE [Gammaproteobacteria bacterium]MBQ0774474.1 urea ABC transporter ATP-binding subunit UrtE [Gammaproteobacteria bacterium]
MLTINGLNQFYGESHILWDVDVEIEQGKCTCIMGRNGVGKTTLLQCIMGQLPISSGTMTYKDMAHKEMALHELPMEKRASLGIGYVPQGRQIFSMLTVEENLMIGLPQRRDKSRRIPEYIFDMFPVLKDMLARRGGDLSGGQQQQLAIGRALVIDPQLLIFDEPTEGIQPNIVSDIGDVIKRLNTELGVTVILVEQKLPFVRRTADCFYILDRGAIKANGTVDELSESLVKEYLTV